MFQVAGGIFLFILCWIALQLVFVGVAMIFHWINDSYYSAAKSSKVVNRR